MGGLSPRVGVILAGGASRRFGRTKAWATLEGAAFVERIHGIFSAIFAENYVVLHEPCEKFQGMKVLLDHFPERSPLNGIYSALMETGEPSIFVAACDLPLLQSKQIHRLLSYWHSDFPALLYRCRDRWEPLLGIYSQGLLPALRQYLNSGRYRLQEFLDAVGAKSLPLSGKISPRALSNINTPQDYQRLLDLGFST